MKTSKPLTRQITLDELISLQEDFPANPSQQQVKERERKTIATSSLKCLESYKRLNPNMFWGKMFLDYLIGQGEWFSTRCALTWKLKGTKSYRYYCQLRAKMHPTSEIESGLLLTPTSSMTDEHPDKMRARAEKNGYKNGTKFGSLLSQVKYSGLLPTPTTQDAHGKENSPSQQHKRDLSIVATRGETSQLNPLFVEEMMGFPKNWTASPFQSGEKKV